MPAQNVVPKPSCAILWLFFTKSFLVVQNFKTDLKKRRKHLLNLGSLEKDCLRTKHFRLALFIVGCFLAIICSATEAYEKISEHGFVCGHEQLLLAKQN